MIDFTIPQGVNHEAIESLKQMRQILCKAFDVEEVWNDNTYERFKQEVSEPVTNLIKDYEKEARDMYEDSSAAVVLAEQILVAQEEMNPTFQFTVVDIPYVRRIMFPDPDLFDYLYNTEQAKKFD